MMLINLLCPSQANKTELNWVIKNVNSRWQTAPVAVIGRVEKKRKLDASETSELSKLISQPLKNSNLLPKHSGLSSLSIAAGD